MEGPSLFLAAEQLAPFINQKILQVAGNTKIGKERLVGKTILDIFSYGKYLVFQFDQFALRVHFLLWGSFEAIINHQKITGDYPKKERATRLSIQLKNGSLSLYSCSIRLIDHAHIKELCDFSKDVMSSEWNDKLALKKVQVEKNSEIGDILLDQDIFMGVGNIIKNEVLIRAGLLPITKISAIKIKKIKEIIQIVRNYVFKFYEWRKKFELRKHYLIYRQSLCKQCGNKVLRKKTGVRKRQSYICTFCEKS